MKCEGKLTAVRTVMYWVGANRYVCNRYGSIRYVCNQTNWQLHELHEAQSLAGPPSNFEP